MKSDQLLFAAKNLLLEALETSGADIISHAHGSEQSSIDFWVDGRAYRIGLTLEEQPGAEMHIEPLRPPRPRRRPLA
jgi:hypothetical protein